jgi:hypothetical protein
MIGAPKCGKTSFVHRFVTGEYTDTGRAGYFHRVRLQVKLPASASASALYLNIVESNNIDADICHARYDATLLFFDINEPYGDVLSLISRLNLRPGPGPGPIDPDLVYDCGHIIVCAAKSDNGHGHHGLDKIIRSLKTEGMILDYMHTSAKTCYGLTGPFVALARLCCGADAILDPSFGSD